MAGQGLHDDIHGKVVMALRPSTRVQNLAVGAASVVSAAFQTVNQNTTYIEGTGVSASIPLGTTHVRLTSTVDCWVLFGLAPVATATNSMLFPAGSSEYFPVDQGDLIAVIQVSGAGTLNIVECN